MKNPTAEISQNDSHYTLHGDYYLPDLDLPEKVSDPIGRYGRMRQEICMSICWRPIGPAGSACRGSSARWLRLKESMSN